MQAVLAAMWLCVYVCLCMCIASLPIASCVGCHVAVCVRVCAYCQSMSCKLHCQDMVVCVCVCVCQAHNRVTWTSAEQR